MTSTCPPDALARISTPPSLPTTRSSAVHSSRTRCSSRTRRPAKLSPHPQPRKQRTMTRSSKWRMCCWSRITHHHHTTTQHTLHNNPHRRPPRRLFIRQHTNTHTHLKRSNYLVNAPPPPPPISTTLPRAHHHIIQPNKEQSSVAIKLYNLVVSH